MMNLFLVMVYHAKVALKLLIIMIRFSKIDTPLMNRLDLNNDFRKTRDMGAKNTTGMLFSRQILLAFFIIILGGCKEKVDVDLKIINATVLDVTTGRLMKNQSIIIKNGKIQEVSDNPQNYNGNETIDANHKLVTPSFIDTHIHPTDVFGDRENAPENLGKTAREDLSAAYLPYGTTTTLILGQPEGWIDTILSWQKNSSPDFTDHYTAGGAIISKEERAPYIGHSVVENAQAAANKVIEYYQRGIEHIKLYYRLNDPEFGAAFKTADSLNMKIYGHIGGFELENLTINNTLSLGLKNYEHLGTIPNTVLNQPEDWEQANKLFNQYFGALDSESRVLEYLLELFRYAENYKKEELDAFIERLAKEKVSFSTTIHFLYQQFHSTYFTTPTDTSLTAEQIARCMENFEILMKCTKQMHDKGIEIRLGSDVPNGGKVNISELILLCKYGFSVADAFKIASLNGAKAMGIEREVGTIEKGKNANLIVWEKSPFEDIENFAAAKTIIKDGRVFQH